MLHLILILQLVLASVSGKVLFCHLFYWSVYRPDLAKFTVNDLDPHLCTHIVYSTLYIDEPTLKVKSNDYWGDFQRGGKGTINELLDLKKENEDLKVLISLGGYNQDPVVFSKLAANKDSRETFIRNVKDFLIEHKLDGADISWRHPAERGGTPADKDNFVTLLKGFKESFAPNNLILAADISCKPYLFEISYKLKEISQNVDFIFARMHHYSQPFEYKTGANTPLGEIEKSLDHLTISGVPPEKILMGLFTMGTVFLMKKPPSTQSYFDLQTSDALAQTDWLNQGGETGFNEVCWNQTTSSGWTEIWDRATQTPVSFKENVLISYDNELSFLRKAEVLLKRKLGGAVVWSLDLDDFKGLCGGKKFPLISQIKEKLAIRSSTEGNFSFRLSVVNQHFAEW